MTQFPVKGNGKGRGDIYDQVWMIRDLENIICDV